MWVGCIWIDICRYGYRCMVGKKAYQFDLKDLISKEIICLTKFG